MSTVSAAPPARTVRHGRTDLQLRIGATWYQLRRLPPPPGFRVVRTLKKLDPHGPPATYTVAQAKGQDARCTCPDHDNGHVCKHIMALAAHGLMALPKAARPKPEPSQARARRAHAKTARAIVAECKALPPEARRHLAAMGPEPAPRPLEELLPDAAPGILLPARPAAKALPPASEGSFTAGFRQAVAAHLALKRGDLVECAACRYPFDPAAEGSAPLALCGPCLAEEKGGAR